MKLDPPILFGSIAIPVAILIGVFLVKDTHKEMDSNKNRASVYLNNVWEKPYKLEEPENTSVVYFYSEGKRYEMKMYDDMEITFKP